MVHTFVDQGLPDLFRASAQLREPRPEAVLAFGFHLLEL
jgi:hypothetical protein